MNKVDPTSLRLRSGSTFMSFQSKDERTEYEIMCANFLVQMKHSSFKSLEYMK